MVIKDSGERRKFGSGAVRDIQEGKGRCDLLPLGVVSEALRIPGSRMNEPVLAYLAEFVYTKDCERIYEALRMFCKTEYKTLPNMLLEVSKHYEDGALKYGEHNWEKGIPTHCYLDSGVRHYLKYLRGDDDEPHNRAFVWNMLGLAWTMENKPELDDIKSMD